MKNTSTWFRASQDSHSVVIANNFKNLTNKLELQKIFLEWESCRIIMNSLEQSMHIKYMYNDYKKTKCCKSAHNIKITITICVAECTVLYVQVGELWSCHLLYTSAFLRRYSAYIFSKSVHCQLANL